MLVFFEKRERFRQQTESLLSDLREREGITALTGLRWFTGYSMDGPVLAEEAEEALRDPVTDLPMLKEPPDDPEAVWRLAWGLLPAQFDQRGESAREAVILRGGQPGRVRSISCCLFYGSITGSEKKAVRRLLMNPVDSGELDLDGDSARLRGFRSLGNGMLTAFAVQHGLVLDEADLRFCRDYYRDVLKRDPTRAELAVLATYWSDHCRHTTFNTRLEEILVQESPFLEGLNEILGEFRAFRGNGASLMEMATAGAKILKERGLLDDLDESEEVNAASVRIGVEYEGPSGAGADESGEREEWLLMFKNETHNHPTEIEPFGGAATCIGGAIRDPLSGRAFVHQAMRLSGAAFPDQALEAAESPVLRESKLTRRTLARESARGYSSYGNQIGVPTGFVRELYHEGFRAKRFEAGAVVGAVPLERVRRERPIPGDVVLLVGGATGRDGIGGATGSSRAHDHDSVGRSAAEVQKGNPPEERALQRFFRRPEVTALIKRCNDFGAGGVAVAVGELAPGLRIDLSAVPLKYSDLSPLEIALSESQERMAVVTAAGDAGKLAALAAAEDLNAAVIAEVTADACLVMEHGGGTVVSLPRSFLDTAGAKRSARAEITAPEGRPVFETIRLRRQAVPERERWAALLREHNVCGGEGLTEQFDSTVGSRSVLAPLGGRYQLTPVEAMAALIPSEKRGVKTASVMSCGYSPEISEWSPFHGAEYALLEAAARSAAAGADLSRVRLSLQEYFPPPGGSPGKWGAPAAALLGALRAQLALSLPAIGGKDSMSGSWMELEVPPVLAAFAASAAPADTIRSPEFKKAGSAVYLLHHRRTAGSDPDFPLFLRHAGELRRLHCGDGLRACRSVGFGGIAQALAEMSFGNRIGFDGTLPEGIDPFDPGYGSFLVEWDADSGETSPGGESVYRIGETTEGETLRLGGLSISIADAVEAWRGPRAVLYPGPGKGLGESTGLPEPRLAVHSEKPASFAPRIGGRGPKVSVLVFPGTNCEEETAAAFAEEGGDVSLHLFRVKSAGAEESLSGIEKAVKGASIVVIPGGFSAGDEPDGAAKYIAAVLSSPRIADAFAELLEHRDGLVLGICNGFQALVRCGLLPHGKVTPRKEEDPVLAHNAVGRHVSRYCGTVCASTLGPWMGLSRPGDLHVVPVSHGEGRFIAPEAMLDRLEASGQVPFRYCGADGTPTEAYPDNPNGSMRGIEALLSPDGRVLGKMGHSERSGRYSGINIPGAGTQPIFRAGINYFR